MPELQVLLEGVFEQRRFLDLLRYFIVFEDAGGGELAKKMAGYHQFHAVNVAVEETLRAAGALAGRTDARPRSAAGTRRRRRPGGEPGDRRVGVVWHTQGSGKSLTMAFYAGPDHPAPGDGEPDDRRPHRPQRPRRPALRHLRPLPRPAAPGRRSRPQDRADLRAKLAVGSGGVVFTTIQKFFPEEKGDRHPVLSDRRNIVVIADEAHRSQYDFIDGFARHMRDALPNASFIGFTGTPIEQTDANTRAVFGDYISVYDIQRAVARRRDRADLLREPAGEAGARRRPSGPRIDPEFEEVDRGRGGRAQGEAQEPLGAARGGGRRREPGPAHRRATWSTHFENRLAAMDGKAMVVVHEPPHRGRAVPRDRRAAAGVGRRRRRRRARSRS